MDSSEAGEELLELLVKRGWQVERSASHELLLPPSLRWRYPRLPEEVTRFVGGLESCINRDENVWLLCRKDYRQTSEQGFRWNEPELMSLEWASSDREREQVREFWDRHFPFMLAVHSDYDYLAVSLDDRSFGEIVHGFAPEFQEAEVIASSFTEFLAFLKLAASGEDKDYPVSLFL